MKTQSLLPAFDLPAGLLILAQGQGIWQACELRGVAIAFVCNGAVVPRGTEVMVRHAQGGEMEAVQVAHKLRTMGWKRTKVEQPA